MLRIVSVYLPTSASHDDEYEKVLNDLQSLLDCPSSRALLPGVGRRRTVVCGDFNCKIGSKQTNNELWIGKHGLGVRNERGQVLGDFCSANQMYIMNSRFQKRESRKWTWLSPDMKTRNLIDYIICKDISLFLDVSIIGSHEFSSDHRLLMARMRIDTNTRIRYRPRKNRVKLSIPEFTASMAVSQVNLSNYCEIVNSMKQIASTCMEPDPRPERLSNATKDLMKKRNELRKKPATRMNRIDLAVTSKVLRVSINDDLYRGHMKYVREAVEYGRSTKIALRSSEVGKVTLTRLKKDDGSIASNKAQVTSTVKSFYNRLYSTTLPTASAQLQFKTDDTFLPILDSEVSMAI